MLYDKNRRPSKILRGSNHPMAKLSWSSVDSIRSLYKVGDISQEKLAEKFGVTKGTIGKIVRRELWVRK